LVLSASGTANRPPIITRGDDGVGVFPVPNAGVCRGILVCDRQTGP